MNIPPYQIANKSKPSRETLYYGRVEAALVLKLASYKRLEQALKGWK